jgi:hypothetical protein
MFLNKYNILFIVLISLVLITKTNAQHKNDFEAGLFNIGFGGIVGGLGAIINKNPNEKTGNVFLKGFSQGALGGYLLFESKRLVGKFGETHNYAYIWPSKLINSAGISMIENAAANRNFGDRWHLNIGFNRFEIHTKEKFKMSYRIMPFALGNTIRGFTKGNLDIDKTIKTGSFVFFTKTIYEKGMFINGATYSNSILISNSTNDLERTLSHELIHVYQYESFSGFNSYVNKLTEKWNTKKWYSTYNKVFYTDLNYLTFISTYNLYPNFDSNFFEKEAFYYTEGKK